MDKYEDEVKERWGDTEAYAESKFRNSKYSHADFAAAKVDQEAATELFFYAFGNSLPVSSEKAQAAVVAHRAAISKWFYECSVEMQKNLALMYVQDPRFKKYYDSRVNGLAQYVHDAIMAQ
ncbi:MAG: TipAS antibiotic-recognition domain-containing protein [Actinomycetes bacterium]